MRSPYNPVCLCRNMFATALIAVAGNAAAEPVMATLDYSCIFPLIEEQPMQVVIHADMPAQLAPGEMTEAFDLDAVAQVSAEAWNGLSFVGSQTLTGSVEASSHISAPGLSLPLTIPLDLTETVLPDAMVTFPVEAVGKTPQLMFTPENAGEVDILVGDLVMKLQPLDSNSNPTGLGIFESECTLDAGQDGLLHTIVITADTSPGMPFLFSGEAWLKNSTVLPLSGRFEPELDLASGELSGQLLVDDSSLTVKLISFFNTLSLEARVVMTSTDSLKGTVSEGNLEAEQEANLQLQDVKLSLFGFPVSSAGMGQCTSKAPFTLHMTSAPGAGFSLLEGGQVTGQFDLPEFSDCGIMTGMINHLLAGPDNEFELMLTPES